eukprot:11789917-Alexandrium_andersonii.AAC.1
MELLAAKGSKETELLSLLVEHQARAGVCASLDLRAGGAVPGALRHRVKFDGRQFGSKRSGERARGAGRHEKLVLGRPLAHEHERAANFDIAPMRRRCRGPVAVEGAYHGHVEARGQTRPPGGKWEPVAS